MFWHKYSETIIARHYREDVLVLNNSINMQNIWNAAYKQDAT
jgi:hypothetical protein